MRELKLTQIWIYPIKSLGGISLSQARVMAKGLQHDRRWMLVDEDGIFITQRIHTILALFKLSLQPNELTITHKGETIALPFDHDVLPEPLEVQIWDDKVITYEVSKFYSEWFSQRVGIACRLVAFPEENARQIEPAYADAGENVSLADAYPFLIIGQSSLDDLNSKLTVPMTIKRFRPNFVFEGGRPFEEDTWKKFDIGDGIFEGIKPCARCVLTTVDPETGEKGVEPLKSLAKYRRWNHKIYFGQNVISRKPTTIHVGDLITINSTSQMSEQLLAIGSA